MVGSRTTPVVAAFDPNLALYDVAPLDAAQTAADRFGSFLLALFATLAVLLAAVGVYGVMAFFVEHAHPRSRSAWPSAQNAAAVRRLVLRRGLAMVTAGIAAGVGGGLLASRFLTTLLYDVRPTDPAIYAAVAFVLLAVAAVANAIPALRPRASRPRSRCDRSRSSTRVARPMTVRPTPSRGASPGSIL